MNSTIFALATPPGRGAVAVFRVSGPRAGNILQALATLPLTPRRALLRRLRDPEGVVLDEALTLWFPGPESFTGEDVFELHLHGGAAVVEAVAETLLTLGAAPAGPGDFTRRAFENGKLDLTRAEAIADLVDAESEAQRRQALRQLGGGLSEIYAVWRERFLQILAWLEAEIDFPDEEDIPEGLASRATEALVDMLGVLDQALSDGARAVRVREGFHVALIGAPNAGKSSLFNLLCEDEAAIVTARAGTTRDVLQRRIRVGPHLVQIFDTAGLRDAEDEIEAEGVVRARRTADTADLRLWIVDGAGEEPGEGSATLRPGDLVVVNKTDLSLAAAANAAETMASAAGAAVVRVSLKTGAGVSDLRRALEQRVETAFSGAETAPATRERHQLRLRRARVNVLEALEVFHVGPELSAVSVRRAIDELEAIVGKIGVEDVLGEVFSKFCIGK